MKGLIWQLCHSLSNEVHISHVGHPQYISDMYLREESCKGLWYPNVFAQTRFNWKFSFLQLPALRFLCQNMQKR